MVLPRAPGNRHRTTVQLMSDFRSTRRSPAMSQPPLYDTIGTTYTVTRRTEPRIAAQIWAALGDCTNRVECRSRHRFLRAGRSRRERRGTVGDDACATCDTTEENWRRRFWLTRDYLPEVAAIPVGLASELARAIGARLEPVLVPWDCADGFFEAYWRRPEAYLDERVRRGISLCESWRGCGATGRASTS